MICARCAEEIDDAVDRCPACTREPWLAGRYRLDRLREPTLLGSCYVGTRRDDELPVWIHELPFRRISGLDCERELEPHVARLAALDHPTLPRWIDRFVLVEGRLCSLWVVHEPLPGVPLELALREQSFDEATVLGMLEQLGGLLDYLHGQAPPIVHGGLVASAVFVHRPEGASELELKVLPSVTALADASLPTEGNTQAGLARVHAHLAPEQLLGRNEAASDYWTLGLLAVVALTRTNPLELRDARGELRWRDRVAVEPRFCALLERLLAPDPAARLIDAGALRERIVDIRRELAQSAQTAVLDARSPPLAAIERAPSSYATPPRRTTTRRIRRSDGEDVPVQRPSELSHELSQAHRATVELEQQTRQRSSMALTLVVLFVALLAAALTWLALRLPMVD